MKIMVKDDRITVKLDEGESITIGEVFEAVGLWMTKQSK